MTESTGVWQVIKDIAPRLDIRMERLEVRGRSGIPDVLWVHLSGLVGRLELKLLRPGRWDPYQPPRRRLGVSTSQARVLRQWVAAGGQGGILAREMHPESRRADRWWYVPAQADEEWVSLVLTERWGELTARGHGTHADLPSFLRRTLLATS